PVPGEVVQPALRGLHLGAEGRHRPVQNRGVPADRGRHPSSKRVDRPLAADWKKLESSREYRNGNALREYQLEGLNWLTFNWYNSRNCILADEMGLGKTIQSITFLYEMYMKSIEGPFLVIAPLSTIPNWEREFRTWTQLNVVVYHGSQASRKTIQAYEMYYRDAQVRRGG
uniref:SNF2 N-terminal domain-containing protein n=1 Tax=Tetraodon nigroviridis TaxID=99883 RepID=H3C7P0_TETNG